MATSEPRPQQPPEPEPALKNANAAMHTTTPSGPSTGPDAPAGPLVVSTANPRYFTIGSGNAADRRVVYLTGSHIWNNLHDGLGPGAAPVPSRWYTNPPAGDGRKVVITDTDHYAPGAGDGLWAWKCFLRGQNPILMDYGIIDVVNPLDPSLGVPAYEAFEAARYVMGDTLRYAKRVGLTEMEPRGELSSTGYMLANPGSDYLVLQPGDTADPFTVSLAAGRYTVEWYSVATRETRGAGEVTVENPATIAFTAPFGPAAPAVLYLQRVGR